MSDMLIGLFIFAFVAFIVTRIYIYVVYGMQSPPLALLFAEAILTPDTSANDNPKPYTVLKIGVSSTVKDEHGAVVATLCGGTALMDDFIIRTSNPPVLDVLRSEYPQRDITCGKFYFPLSFVLRNNAENSTYAYSLADVLGKYMISSFSSINSTQFHTEENSTSCR